MAVRPEPQPSLPLGWAPPNVSLPEPTQAAIIAALADLMLQLKAPTAEQLHTKG